MSSIEGKAHELQRKTLKLFPDQGYGVIFQQLRGTRSSGYVVFFARLSFYAFLPLDVRVMDRFATLSHENSKYSVFDSSTEPLGRVA